MGELGRPAETAVAATSSIAISPPGCHRHPSEKGGYNEQLLPADHLVSAPSGLICKALLTGHRRSAGHLSPRSPLSDLSA